MLGSLVVLFIECRRPSRHAPPLPTDANVRLDGWERRRETIKQGLQRSHAIPVRKGQSARGVAWRGVAYITKVKSPAECLLALTVPRSTAAARRHATKHTAPLSHHRGPECSTLKPLLHSPLPAPLRSRYYSPLLAPETIGGTKSRGELESLYMNPNGYVRWGTST